MFARELKLCVDNDRDGDDFIKIITDADAPLE